MKIIDRIHNRLLRSARLPRALSEATVKLAGVTFHAPVVDGLYCGVTEPWMIDVLTLLANNSSGAIVDVGVNLGQTLIAIKAIDPARRYIGFEPNPSCVAYVERLVARNRLKNIEIVPVALSNAAGIARLQIYGSNTNDSAASIVEQFRPNEKVASYKYVPTAPFSAIAASLELADIAIVKIDVEGAEWDVLQSMAEALTHSKPWIVIEILPCYNSDNTQRIDRQDALQSLMKELGYTLTRIKKTSSQRLEGLEPIDRIGIHGSIELCDYVFVPQGRQVPRPL